MILNTKLSQNRIRFADSCQDFIKYLVHDLFDSAQDFEPTNEFADTKTLIYLLESCLNLFI